VTWARPDLLALLLAVPIVLVAVVLAERARRRVLTVFAALETLPLLVSSGVTRARTLQAVCAVLAASGLVLAAAGPRLGFEWQQQSVEGVSIAVVLDVSRSMDAADVSPSRLERARREILDLAGLLRGDAVALVIFAAGPYVRIPLTVDYDTFLWAVEDSSSDTIRAQGTALAGALEAAVGLLANASGSGKAVLVVSDGEGHDESAALDAALAAARDAEVRVYALGIGDPGGAPIPLPEGGFKKDATGSVVLSRLDEAALTAATVADRILLIATPDVPGIKNTWRRLQLLERLGIEKTRVHVVVNRWDKRDAPFSLADVAQNIGRKVDATVAYDKAAFRSVNEGKLLRDVDKRSQAARDVEALVGLVTDGEIAVEKTASGGWLPKLFGG
jgi:hypothetical protein